MKQTDEIIDAKKTYNLQALCEKADALRKGNPELQADYDRLMNSIPDTPATDEETRKAYQDLLDRRMNGESIHANWGDIIQWLKEHPSNE